MRRHLRNPWLHVAALVAAFIIAACAKEVGAEQPNRAPFWCHRGMCVWEITTPGGRACFLAMNNGAGWTGDTALSCLAGPP